MIRFKSQLHLVNQDGVIFFETMRRLRITFVFNRFWRSFPIASQKYDCQLVTLPNYKLLLSVPKYVYPVCVRLKRTDWQSLDQDGFSPLTSGSN